MTALIVALLAYGTFAPREYPGTYQITPTNGAIVRIDTRTGKMERCVVVGTSVTCEQIVARSE